MYHPTTRVLTVLELLQTHGQLRSAELAERLEVSERSIRHYVTLLQDLGIPVEAVRGRYGGYRLRPGYKLPPLLFTADEAVALTLGLLLARRGGLRVAAPALEGALAKLERVLPEQVRAQVHAIQTTLIFASGNVYPAPQTAVVTLLCTAAQQQRQVDIRYSDWRGTPSARRIDPYGLVAYSGRWFVVAWCHLRQDRRIFRLDRVVAAELLETGFERPAELDLLAVVIEALVRTPGKWHAAVLLDIDLATAQQCIDPIMGTLTAVDGGVELHCDLQDLDWFAHFLLGLPFPMRILEPPELREALRRLALRGLERAGLDALERER